MRDRLCIKVERLRVLEVRLNSLLQTAPRSGRPALVQRRNATRLGVPLLLRCDAGLVSKPAFAPSFPPAASLQLSSYAIEYSQWSRASRKLKCSKSRLIYHENLGFILAGENLPAAYHRFISQRELLGTRVMNHRTHPSGGREIRKTKPSKQTPKWQEFPEMAEVPAYAPIWRKRSYDGRDGHTESGRASQFWSRFSSRRPHL